MAARVLEHNLPAILDRFYEHAAATPQLARMIGNDIPRLKGAQGAHWGPSVQWTVR
ncbi:protoglobin domain-containing protein [Bradyrhizobium sp. DASA03120]|uniref:protoglobin domain-containing protein n=1 Tax=Bradyrhizobium sp. SMVTL-02 TaxID=3395917 RepID=UPI003F7119FD